MRTGIEVMQKWIIIGAIALGVLICATGFTYKFLFKNDTVPAKLSINQAKSAMNNPAPAFKLQGLYTKLRLGTPVNMLILGDDASNSWSKLLPEKLEKQFHSKVDFNIFNLYKGTAWSGLISLNKYIKSSNAQPDLILLSFGLNDKQELNDEQHKAIYEAIIRTARQSYPLAEILMVQQLSLSPDIKTIQNQLADYYGLPLVDISDTQEKDKTGPNFSADKIIGLLNGRMEGRPEPKQTEQLKPLSDIKQYSSWRRVEDFSAAQFMDKANVPDAAPRLVSSRAGARMESTFTGSAVGVMLKCVPDGGLVKLYVDGKACGIIDTYAPEPVMKTVLLADNLAPGEHTVKLYVLGKKNYQSQGTRVIWYGYDVTG